MISFSSSLRLNVMKYNPYVNKTPNKQTWHISIKNKMEQGKSEMLLLLNTLFYTHNELDSTFTFRRSCKEGSCAAINIDGVNTLSLSCLYRINYEELDKKVKQLIQ